MKTTQPQITLGQPADLDELFAIYTDAKRELERNGIHQWTDSYPTRSIIEDDLRKGVLYVLRFGAVIVGAINLSQEQEAAYESIAWEFDASKVLVIHRLVVSPRHQRQGHARRLMDFAEQFATDRGYTSIRLDAYSVNDAVIAMYKRRGYVVRGDVWFPGREHPFRCMERMVD